MSESEFRSYAKQKANWNLSLSSFEGEVKTERKMMNVGHGCSSTWPSKKKKTLDISSIQCLEYAIYVLLLTFGWSPICKNFILRVTSDRLFILTGIKDDKLGWNLKERWGGNITDEWNWFMSTGEKHSKDYKEDGKAEHPKYI